jgi:hypothetical protein
MSLQRSRSSPSFGTFPKGIFSIYFPNTFLAHIFREKSPSYTSLKNLKINILRNAYFYHLFLASKKPHLVSYLLSPRRKDSFNLTSTTPP